MALEKRRYSDLDLSFTPHPDTGDLIPLRGDRAIARAVRQIVSTNFYEKFYNPSFGGNVISQLFEQYDSQTEHIIKTKIQEAIRDYEPRVRIQSIQVMYPPSKNLLNQNTLVLQIQFYIVGETESKQITFSLKRVR